MWYVEHITRSNIFKAANCKFLYFISQAREFAQNIALVLPTFAA
jgi:hypothetical protein